MVKGDSSTTKGIRIGVPLTAPNCTWRLETDSVWDSLAGRTSDYCELKGALSEQRNTTDTLSAGELQKREKVGKALFWGPEEMLPTRHSLCIHITWV